MLQEQERHDRRPYGVLADNIYSANAGTTAFRQLYVNGMKAIRARTPNLLANNVANFNRLSGWDKTANNVQVPSSAVAAWNNLTKVEMHINIAWGDSTVRIASTTTTGSASSIKFQSPESPMVFVRPNPRMDQVGWGSGRAYYYFSPTTSWSTVQPTSPRTKPGQTPLRTTAPIPVGPRTPSPPLGSRLLTLTPRP